MKSVKRQLDLRFLEGVWEKLTFNVLHKVNRELSWHPILGRIPLGNIVRDNIR